jgi:UMP-CMP kinase
MDYQDKYLKYKAKYFELKNSENELEGGGKSKDKSKINKIDSQVIFLLGGPGSGKGTLGEKVAKKYKYELISAGDLLREEKQKPNSKNGELINKYQIEGKIVPSEITIGLIKSKIAELNSKGINKILLDGFPRNYENLEKWNEIIGDSIKFKFVIFLNCPEKIMIERVLKRGETSGRSDDNRETVEKRIKVYNEQTLPVIKYYKKLNKVKEIDASKNAEQVFDSVKKLFEKDTKNKSDKNNKYIIGVAGASGCGKTYFSNYLKKQLEKKFSVEIISCDDYYKNYSEKKNSKGKWITPLENNEPNFNWDIPSVIDLKLLQDDLVKFKSDINITIPDYDFKECHRKSKPKNTINSSDTQVIIVEGLYVLYDENLREEFNLKIFIESDSEICLARRVFRDIGEGRKVDINATNEEKNKIFNNLINVYKKNIRPSYVQYIDPTKKYSDIIVNSEIDYSNTDTKTINLILNEVQDYIK